LDVQTRKLCSPQVEMYCTSVVGVDVSRDLGKAGELSGCGDQAFSSRGRKSRTPDIAANKRRPGHSFTSQSNLPGQSLRTATRTWQHLQSDPYAPCFWWHWHGQSAQLRSGPLHHQNGSRFESEAETEETGSTARLGASAAR
jgi:hypothetical protein